jgi:hypothetical protein
MSLSHAVTQLPRGQQQEVLPLVFYQDLTITESARALGISLGSARTHFEAQSLFAPDLILKYRQDIGLDDAP